ncbi:hypothetical protein, partial [Escherichia coli]|uniref:hypothetical protein n=1 Tax=Escherichia coli TaxID=562 RepID=UPI00226E7924
MHSWKKKLVVSQLALACTLAITSQANATTYNTWTYYDNPTTALDWSNMDLPGTVDGNYVNYSGWICPYISRHLLSLNPLLACCRRYSR